MRAYFFYCPNWRDQNFLKEISLDSRLEGYGQCLRECAICPEKILALIMNKKGDLRKVEAKDRGQFIRKLGAKSGLAFNLNGYNIENRSL